MNASTNGEWKLFEKCRKYIHFCALRYRIRNHYLLNYEDLTSEGYYVFAKTKEIYGEVEEFEKIFHSALHNHYKDLLKKMFCRIHEGFVVDITEAYNLFGPVVMEEKYIRRKINHLKNILPKDTALVLEEMAFPSPKTIHLAERRGKPPHIRNKDIIQSVGITQSRMLGCIGEIKRQLGFSETNGHKVGSEFPIPERLLSRIRHVMA